MQSYAQRLDSRVYTHRIGAEAAVRRGEHATALRHLAMAMAYSDARADYLQRRDSVTYTRSLSEYHYFHDQADMAEAFIEGDRSVQVVPGGSYYERVAEAREREAAAAQRSAQTAEALKALVK
jgi:hypothetical protein